MGPAEAGVGALGASSLLHQEELLPEMLSQVTSPVAKVCRALLGLQAGTDTGTRGHREWQPQRGTMPVLVQICWQDPKS
ncbi:hypothetical protein EK904_007693 [Melospiza melodia maxima]|nr:hypothetical protein EK904_007693 [Melospiza melodia maxima]